MAAKKATPPKKERIKPRGKIHAWGKAPNINFRLVGANGEILSNTNQGFTRQGMMKNLTAQANIFRNPGDVTLQTVFWFKNRKSKTQLKAEVVTL